MCSPRASQLSINLNVLAETALSPLKESHSASIRLPSIHALLSATAVAAGTLERRHSSSVRPPSVSRYSSEQNRRFSVENLLRPAEVTGHVNLSISTSPSSTSSSSSCTQMSKRERRKTSELQLLALMKVFQHRPIPTRLDRIKLSEEIGMSPRAIQVWFQNRRQQLKKANVC